jgi:hypothetical protein
MLGRRKKPAFFAASGHLTKTADMEVNRRMKMVVFWVDAPCSLIEIGRRFRASYCIRHQVNISEDGHLHTRRRENLKSRMFFLFVSDC